MYGGTAKTYCTWKMQGEPFQEGKVWYVYMIHPSTGVAKRVRWYMDKAHADMMPNAMPKQFAGKIFGFESKDDYIIAIKDRDLTQQEVQKYFYSNWERGGKWVYGMFFGGIWYAPKTAEVPAIKRADHVFRVTWNEFLRAGQALSRKNNEGAETGFWFNEATE